MYCQNEKGDTFCLVLKLILTIWGLQDPFIEQVLLCAWTNLSGIFFYDRTRITSTKKLYWFCVFLV